MTDPLPRGVREIPPMRRPSTIQKAVVGGHKVYTAVSAYPDGRPCEVFITLHREGSAFRALMECMAMMISLGLQYGIPLEKIAHTLSGSRFEPDGVVEGNAGVKECRSIVDYVVQEMVASFETRRST